MTRPIGISELKIPLLLKGLMVFALLAAGAVSLRAQTYSLFVMGGGSSLFDKQYYSVYGAPYGSTYKTGEQFTIGTEIPVTKILSAEASYGFGRNNLAVTDFYNSGTLNQRTEYGIQRQRVSADVIAHASNLFKGVRPYLAAGVEFDRFAPTGSGAALAASPGFNGVPNAVLAPDDKFGFNIGGGLDVKLVRRLALRLDARDHITGTPTYGLPSAVSSTYTAYYPIQGRAHDVEYSAGFVFRFGK